MDYGDLFQPFVEAYKPRNQWAIGVESERFGLHAQTGAPIKYQGPSGVMEVFNALASRFGWRPEREVPDGPVIMLNRDRASITLEPGGQVELSGSPQVDLHAVRQETEQHIAELQHLGSEFGLAWAAIGFQPLARENELDWVPKQRYAIMREYLITRGIHAHNMMRRTATVQVNLDFADERDMMRKFHLAQRISPVISSMFANAPFVEGRLFGGRSFRLRVWFDVDPDRQGLLPQLWNRNTRLDDYVQWALDVPMFLFKRDGKVVANTGQSFRAFMRDGHHGHRATLEDWRVHLNTLFPEVRLKRTIEMRGGDSLPMEWICALPALWTGIMYDDTALEQAERLSWDWTFEEMEDVRANALLHGMNQPFRGKEVSQVAEKLFLIARDGLTRRGRVQESSGNTETVYLDAMGKLVEHSQTPADLLIKGLDNETDLRSHILRSIRP